jgi:hypothetical protein
MVGDTSTYFNAVFDADQFEKMRENGEIKFSYKAMLAACLFFFTETNRYCNNPIDYCRD